MTEGVLWMEEQFGTDPERKRAGIHPAVAALIGIICVAAGIVVGSRLMRPGGGGTPPAAAVSVTESADSGTDSFSGAEEIAGPEETVSEAEETQSAEDLAGVIGAAVSNVGNYAVLHRKGRHVICIDPGHQDHGMADTEQNGPGSTVMKAKLTTGTQGTATGNTEYEINLEIGLILRDVLRSKGYTVVMTREINDVSISNAERARFAAASGAEVFLRLHCNGASDSSVRGVVTYQPSSSNPYLSQDVITKSQILAQLLGSCQCSKTGQKFLGVVNGDDMTGINWAEMPVSIIEMGYMSNPDEDRFLGSPEGQKLIAEGIADGVDAFFEEQEQTEGN